MFESEYNITYLTVLQTLGVIFLCLIEITTTSPSQILLALISVLFYFLYSFQIVHFIRYEGHIRGTLKLLSFRKLILVQHC